MEKIFGMDVNDLTELYLEGEPYRFDRSPEDQVLLIQKGISFVQSVLGRELLHSLKYHRCNICDSMQLEVAEIFVAKRKLNPKAINMLASRFVTGTLRASLKPEIDGKVLQASEFFAIWVQAFLSRGPEILHGNVKAEDVLGEGTMLETWKKLEDFLKED